MQVTARDAVRFCSQGAEREGLRGKSEKLSCRLTRQSVLLSLVSWWVCGWMDEMTVASCLVLLLLLLHTRCGRGGRGQMQGESRRGW